MPLMSSGVTFGGCRLSSVWSMMSCSAGDDDRAADAASTSLVRSSQPTSALAVVQDFDPKAASLLLEEEVREAVVGTVGTAVGMIAACTYPLSCKSSCTLLLGPKGRGMSAVLAASIETAAPAGITCIALQGGASPLPLCVLQNQDSVTLPAAYRDLINLGLCPAVQYDGLKQHALSFSALLQCRLQRYKGAWACWSSNSESCSCLLIPSNTALGCSSSKQHSSSTFMSRLLHGKQCCG